MRALSPSHRRFPQDTATYRLDRQFLWGRSLLVTPVLEPGVDSVTGYFPRGVWYDFYTVRSAATVLGRVLGGPRSAEEAPGGCRRVRALRCRCWPWGLASKWLLPGPFPEPPMVSLSPLGFHHLPRAPL